MFMEKSRKTLISNHSYCVVKKQHMQFLLFFFEKRLHTLIKLNIVANKFTLSEQVSKLTI